MARCTELVATGGFPAPPNQELRAGHHLVLCALRCRPAASSFVDSCTRPRYRPPFPVATGASAPDLVSGFDVSSTVLRGVFLKAGTSKLVLNAGAVRGHRRRPFSSETRLRRGAWARNQAFCLVQKDGCRATSARPGGERVAAPALRSLGWWTRDAAAPVVLCRADLPRLTALLGRGTGRQDRAGADESSALRRRLRPLAWRGTKRLG